MKVPADVFKGPVGGARSETRFERRLKVTGRAELVVRTGSGHINVSAGEGPAVEIRGTIRGRDPGAPANGAAKRLEYLASYPPVSQSGNLIMIGHITNADLQRDISIHYDVVVPVETGVSASTGAGSISIEGITGPVEAVAGSGAITAEGIGGDVRAEAGSGEIEIRWVKGNARLSTGSGAIYAAGVEGNLRAATAGGTIEAADVTAGEAEASTCTGNIDLRNAGGMVRASSRCGNVRVECREARGAMRLETVSGNITVRLAGAANPEVSMRTIYGAIRASRPIVVRPKPKRRNSEAESEAGGVKLEIATVWGDIRIK